MYDEQSLSHTMLECKYHIVWIRKYRKKAIFGDLKKYLGEIFRDLTAQRECKVVEGHVMSIPSNHPVSMVVGFIKGKSAIHIARNFEGRKKNLFDY
ncbi:MAG: IS200/IS605 family transposase [Pseudomonadota bacterium]